MILSLDLGTSLTKAGLWSEDGLVAMGRSRIETVYGPGGRVEQDPSQWWPSVKQAVSEALAAASEAGVAAAGDVEVIAFSSARQSFVPVDSECRPIGAALVWSDRRAGAEASVLSARLGGAERLRERTGIYYDAGSVAAKLAWLTRHEPGRLDSARWLLTPRDALVFELTGQVSTDVTLVSAAGLYDDEGRVAEDILRAALLLGGPSTAMPEAVHRDPAAMLPEVRPPDCIVGGLLTQPARELGLTTAGIPVVIGAGDRACEALGAGASLERPMVSWGTTANVSVPLDSRPRRVTPGLILTRATEGNWLLEGGLSAAGSLIEWISRLVGLDVAELTDRADHSLPGAAGVIVLPWLGGARAPWWNSTASVSVLGLRPEHNAGDLTRAAIEAVAYDVARCLEAAFSQAEGGGPPGLHKPRSLALGGSGATVKPWVRILTAVTGVPVVLRRSGEAASAGAALLAGRAIGLELDLERVDPVMEIVEPDESDVGRYEELRPVADRLAAATIASLAGETG